MTIEEIRKNAPKGATHYLDGEKGFDYVRIDMNELWIDIWNARFSCFLPIGYIAKSSRYKPLHWGLF
mgnify:FL=1